MSEKLDSNSLLGVDCCCEDATNQLFPSLQLAKNRNILLDVRNGTLNNICDIPTKINCHDCIGYFVQFNDDLNYSWPQKNDLAIVTESKEISPNTTVVVCIKEGNVMEQNELAIVTDIKKLPKGVEILETAIVEEEWLACLINKTANITYLNNGQIIGMIQKRRIKLK